jgi:NitT/TauT family transport system permease protein
VVFLGLWELAPRVGIIDRVFFPPFSVVIVKFFQLLFSGVLPKHLVISLRRALIGFVLGTAVSVPLGMLIGWFKKFERIVDPLLQAFRQTSAIALYPVLIVFFGLGESSKVALVFWATMWAVLMNAISGVKNVDPILIKAARAMGASQFTIFVKVILPGAMPQLLTGIRLSATSSVLILVAAEMMGASKGLGYMLYDAQSRYKIPEMYVSILTMCLLGLAINFGLSLLEKKILGYREEVNKIA